MLAERSSTWAVGLARIYDPEDLDPSPIGKLIDPGRCLMSEGFYGTVGYFPHSELVGHHPKLRESSPCHPSHFIIFHFYVLICVLLSKVFLLPLFLSLSFLLLFPCLLLASSQSAFVFCCCPLFSVLLQY
ncbi:uncharacterized protein B0T15DRAFT_141499 [Chaetomium strumarium]|uniref:Uncharacterized protein n=1 Tax=Chaetomium strumarium TaxID=1170767 RepID=A0AAJ0M2A6_9PEZI|nr:hypothetical protein B0T15DRAFT_141499 [Chaetomium strumarium]